jgi:hypothetical protein
MTVRIDSDEKCVSFYIEGDIYDEHAECLNDMITSHVRRGIKDLDIKLCDTYYISRRGRQCLQGLKDVLGRQGLWLSFNGQPTNVNCIYKSLK